MQSWPGAGGPCKGQQGRDPAAEPQRQGAAGARRARYARLPAAAPRLARGTARQQLRPRPGTTICRVLQVLINVRTSLGISKPCVLLP